MSDLQEKNSAYERQFLVLPLLKMPIAARSSGRSGKAAAEIFKAKLRKGLKAGRQNRQSVGNASSHQRQPAIHLYRIAGAAGGLPPRVVWVKNGPVQPRSEWTSA